MSIKPNTQWALHLDTAGVQGRKVDSRLPRLFIIHKYPKLVMSSLSVLCVIIQQCTICSPAPGGCFGLSLTGA